MATSIVEYVLRMSGNLPAESKEAARNIAEMERASDKAKGAVEKLGQLGGGAVGELTAAFADATDVLDGMGAAMGGVGLAAGVGAVAVAGLAIGAHALADAALAATDRLTEQGLAAMIPAESMASVEAYRQASTDLRTELDLLTVTIGSGVAGALSEAALAAIGAVDALEELGASASAIIDPLSSVGYALSWLSPVRWELAAAELVMGKLADRGQDVADAFAEVKASAEAAKNAMSDVDMLLALGMVSPDTPAAGPSSRGSARPAVSAPGYIGSADHAAALNVAREGVEAARDLNRQIDDLILDLAAGGDMTRQNTTALERLPGEIGGAMDASLRDAQRESAAQTLNLVQLAVGTVTGLLDIPGQVRDIIRSAPQLAVQAISDTLDLYGDAIPETIDALITDVPRALIAAAPQIALSFATLGPRIALEFLGVFVQGVQDLFSPDFWVRAGRSFGAAVLQELGDLLDPFRAGGALGTDLKPAKGEHARLLGIKLPSFESARDRPVQFTQSGLALVHQGEVIGGAGALGGRGGVSVTVQASTIVGAGAGRELARLIRDELGSLGSGARLTPRGA